MIMFFHGYGAPWPPKNTSYHEMAERENVILVSPKGMNDVDGTLDNDKYIGWNVGLLDKGIENADSKCWENLKGRCYDSCNGKCSRCSGSTCIDDVHFIEEL